MRAIAILLILAVSGASLPAIAADDDGKTGESGQAIKVKPEAQKQAYPGVRMQQGRVQTDDDLNSSKTRKLPGLHKSSDITLKRGIISREALLRQRSALEPLKARTSTAGMRTAEAEYAKALRDWAVQQDKQLLELQKMHTAYDRLKAWRDHAAANGEDTSRIDPRLAGMERDMASLSGLIRQNYQKLEKMSAQAETANMLLSNMSKSMHEKAKGIIHNARS